MITFSDLIRFHYPPAVVPAAQDDQITFATVAPDHHAWLCAQGITFQVTCYRWPEMLARFFCLPLGTTVCELHVGLSAVYSTQFAAFSGMIPEIYGGR